MNALELLTRLRAAGIRLTVHDGNLRLTAAKGALTDELRQALAAHKQDIVALLGGADESAPQLTALPRAADARFALSYAQQRLWFLDELEPGTPVYNMPFAVRLHGRLDVPALQAALRDLCLQHEALRTVFVSTGTAPVQRILPQATLQLQTEELLSAPAAGVEARLRELARTSFNLATGPLANVHLLKTGAEDYLLVLVAHHIIFDLWSRDVFFRDLAAWYEHHTADVAPRPATPPIQYADYAQWQRRLLTGDRLQRHVDYWLQRLADAPPVLELVTDRPRPPEPDYRGNWQALRFDAPLSDALHALAQSHGCTLFMVTFSAFAALLHKYSGADDLVIGTPISGRQQTALEPLIGFFLNTLALRVTFPPGIRFRELLEQVKATALAAYAHQDLPFEKLVEELQPERDMSHTPVFQHMFIWQENTAASRLKLAGLQTDPAELISHDTAKFDLTLAMTSDAAGIEAGIEYSTDLFDTATIGRMLAHLQTLLRGVTQQPDVPLANIPLLDAAERRQIVTGFNATDVDFGPAGCVHDLVEQQALRTPGAQAVVFGTTALTYAELMRRSQVLAAELQSRGVTPGSIVAISCERSIELPVAALAVLQAGGCYVPVDPHYPAERIAAMLSDSGAQLVLTQTTISLPAHTATRIELDIFDFSGARVAVSAAVRPEDPLYCIYTSGSTGKPKGVQLSHAGLWNLLRWQQNHERLCKPARTLQFASFSFDVSFQEMFSTWSTGGTLVMVDEELRQDLPQLALFIASEGIERLYLPFAALQPIAETLTQTRTHAVLRDIVVAGEALQVSPAVRALFAQLPGAALHNQYGPSETHVVTTLTLTGAASDWPALPSIGVPVANTRAYVLDARMQPVPIGVPGELFLGGIQVGIGYLQRPELNAEKFLPSPFVAGDRLYRTGDRVRYRPDGKLEFLGRADEQFKWRGFRIEPGEIEAALTVLPGVGQAVVMIRTDGPGNNRQLVGYVTGTMPLDAAALRQALKNKLPDYMVPTAIVVLDALPLTPSGKVARRKLPAPEYARDEATPYVAPRNAVEEQLVAIWSAVLGAERAGIHDDFFALGGHSLLATQLVSRVRDHFHISLPLKFIFRYPTPASLAETVTTLQAALQAGSAQDDGERDELRI